MDKITLEDVQDKTEKEVLAVVKKKAPEFLELVKSMRELLKNK